MKTLVLSDAHSLTRIFLSGFVTYCWASHLNRLSCPWKAFSLSDFKKHYSDFNKHYILSDFNKYYKAYLKLSLPWWPLWLPSTLPRVLSCAVASGYHLSSPLRVLPVTL